MKVFLLLFLSLSLIPDLKAQLPNADFNLPISSCTNENLTFINNSTNASTFEWDFCQGDFFSTPIIDNNILSSSIDISNGLKIVQDGNNYFGFATSTTNNNLYRFDYGSDLLSSPAITNLGNLGVLDTPEGIDIIKEGANWIGLIGHSLNGGGEVIRVVWNDISGIPAAEKISNFGVFSRIREVQIVLQGANYIVVMPYYNGSTLLRVDFGSSLLNTPALSDIYESSALSNVQFPIGMSVVNQSGNWKVILGSILTKTISVFDLGADILSNPTEVKSQTFSSFSNLSKLKVITEGETYYAFVSTSGTSHLLNLKSLAISDNFEEILFSAPPSLSGIDIIKEESTHYIYGTKNNMSRLVFQADCPIESYYSAQFNPLNSYSLSGTYPITLTAYNSNGNQNSITKQTTISSSIAPQPASQITGNCLTNPISFSGQQISGNITNWNWDFGDGSGTSSLQNASYTYASAGSYQVKLSVTDANGCNNLLIDTVQVYEEPIPDFSYPAGNLCMNNPVLFTNTTTGETGQAVTWNWNFNGEGSSSEKDPSFTFLTPGSKIITLTSSIPGCANVTQQTISMEESPTSAFSFNNTCNGSITNFTDQTTGSNLTTWNWDFGDGTNSTDQNPTQNYAAPGKYTVTLTVANSLGCSTTKVDTVYSHAIPVVSFTNDLPCSTSPINFTDQTVVANANMVAWEWDFGDGTTSTDQNPQHLYGQTGDFLVTLKAYSQFGCFSNTQSTVSVAQGPEVDFEWDKSCQGEVTSFTDLTNSFGIAITNWTWIIDGSLFTSQNPTYTFSNSGTYTVQLTVTGVNLCAQTLTQDIIVEVPPIVQFGYKEGCGSSGTEFYDLTNQVNDNIIAREWRVDGAVFSSDSATSTNLAPGNYAITLSVITNAGCEETTTQNITLIGSPVANFTTNTNFGAAPLVVNFTNLSTGGTTYLWSFGDGNNSTSAEQNPSFTFNELGVYTVTLKTSSNPTCFDEFTQQIEVVEPISSGEVMAITPITNGDKINFIITLENTGTSIIDQSSSLVFRADYGAEVIEPINTIVYAANTINYMASYALASSSSTQNLCVELRNPSTVQLDRECIVLNSNVIISEPYPNPTSGTSNIDVILEKESSSIKVRVVNRAGQPVYANAIDGIIGLNTITIDGNGLPQGLYIIEVIIESRTERFKLSIVR